MHAQWIRTARHVTARTERKGTMKFDVLMKTAHAAVIEFADFGKFYTDRPYELFVNGESRGECNKVVQSVYGLEPETEYTVKAVSGEESCEATFTTEFELTTLNVREFGAKGDGETDDTIFIQTAILCCPKGGRVLIPAGTYRTTSLFLKSDLVLEFEKGAKLLAFHAPWRFPILPGLIPANNEGGEYNLGTWEGDPEPMYGSILTGVNVENIVITGEGVIDGNASDNDWWGEHGKRQIEFAKRPRMIFLNHCRNVTVHGLLVTNSPAWNNHPYFSDDIKYIDVTIRNPKISPNTDGIDPESVNGMLIAGVYFSLGDDCIAVKSGRFYMGHKYKKSSENIEIRHCYMKHGHGSVTIGSEMAAGVKNLYVHDCIFEDTDRGLRVKTRRGRGNDAVTENVTFENIDMEGVLTPFVVNSYYWCCDPDGHSEYVRTKEPLPVDERTPFVGELNFRNIVAHNCHVAATFIYGLPEAKIEKVTFENVAIDFADECTPEYPAMMADVDMCTRRGLFVNNVKELVMKNVTIEGVEGETFEFDNIDKFVQE